MARLTDPELIAEAKRRIGLKRPNMNTPSITEVVRDGNRVRGLYIVHTGEGVEIGFVDYSVDEIEAMSPTSPGQGTQRKTED